MIVSISQKKKNIMIVSLHAHEVIRQL